MSIVYSSSQNSSESSRIFHTQLLFGIFFVKACYFPHVSESHLIINRSNIREWKNRNYLTEIQYGNTLWASRKSETSNYNINETILITNELYKNCHFSKNKGLAHFTFALLVHGKKRSKNKFVSMDYLLYNVY